MRYDDQDRESKNVEDRRGQGGGGFPGLGGGIRLPIGGGGMSITTMLIIGAIMLLFGMNPLDLLRGAGPGGGQVSMPELPSGQAGSRTSNNPFELPGRGQSRTGPPQSDDAAKVFMGKVLADTEDVWTRTFQSFGKRYAEPQMVIFEGATRTACGTGQTAMGPFYCPADQKVYIDLAFFKQLEQQFKAGGDFAQAYVIAHEVGHHVQTLLGIAGRVQELKQSMNEKQANALQVRMELQADCLAGVWANLNEQVKSRLQPGDVEEALNAAAQIGDDMIQRKMTGRIVPDAFTHGTAAQRATWLKKGLATGNIKACDTFNAAELG